MTGRDSRLHDWRGRWKKLVEKSVFMEIGISFEEVVVVVDVVEVTVEVDVVGEGATVEAPVVTEGIVLFQGAPVEKVLVVEVIVIVVVVVVVVVLILLWSVAKGVPEETRQDGLVAVV